MNTITGSLDVWKCHENCIFFSAILEEKLIFGEDLL